MSAPAPLNGYDAGGPRPAPVFDEAQLRGLHPTDFGWLAPDAAVFEPVVVLRPENVLLLAGCRIDSFVKIEGGRGVVVGPRVHVSSFAHLNIGGGRLDVGEGAAITSGCRVLSGSNTRRGKYMSSVVPEDECDIERLHTIVGEGAFIGANAVILPGRRIGRFAIVGAGSVVTKDVPDYAVCWGAPARLIGTRSDRVEDFFAGAPL